MEQQFVSIRDAETFLGELFSALGMERDNVRTMQQVLIQTTMYNRGHHDISFVPMLVKLLRSKQARANPDMKMLSSYQGIERWDGDDGLGPVCCMRAMERAMELAKIHGIGICAMRRTNHFLASAPYTELAAKSGYVGLILAKGGVSMGVPGEKTLCMSALPMGYAYPTQSDPVVFDACMAYASIGKLNQMVEKGQQVPSWWGVDKEGTPTTSPAELLQGIRYPIGGHKGFALAMLGEVLTGVLSGGCILDQPQTEDGHVNWSSHTAIAIKADALMGLDEFEARAASIGQRACARAEHLHIPGQGLAAERRKIAECGSFVLKESLIQALNDLAADVGVPPIRSIAGKEKSSCGIEGID